MNPVIPKRKPQIQPKKVYKEVFNQQNIEIDEPNNIHTVPYQLENVPEIKETNRMAISETRSFDILIVGYPFNMIVKDIQNYDIDLV